MGTGILLLVSFISVILATQTRLIRLLGPLPKSFVGEDYKSLAAKIDSMEYLSETREKKLAAIQKLITKGVYVSPPEKEIKEKPAKVKENDSSMADQSCLLYTSPSPRDRTRSRMPSSA